MKENQNHLVQAESGYTRLETYRYERKFLLEGLPIWQAAAIIKLHPKMFSEPYPPRYVNNLYLDSPDMENYYDNVNGAAQRRKVRLRWYGTPFGQVHHPVLEIKVKNGLAGTKHAYPLAPFCLDQSFSSRYFRSILMISSLPENVYRDLCRFEIVLLNRYYRYYYASRDGNFRVTLDSQMSFYRVNSTIGNSFLHRQINHHNLVVELKYDIDQDLNANRVASFFPFRVTKNSKYVEGIERVYF